MIRSMAMKQVLSEPLMSTEELLEYADEIANLPHAFYLLLVKWTQLISPSLIG